MDKFNKVLAALLLTAFVLGTIWLIAIAVAMAGLTLLEMIR